MKLCASFGWVRVHMCDFVCDKWPSFNRRLYVNLALLLMPLTVCELNCFAVLQQLCSIRWSSSVFRTLVVALMLSKLDYGILHRLASWSTILQSALVAAARSVDGFQRLDRITVTVASFYQLREASKGISLKLTVIAVHGTAPWCLTDLLHTYHPIKKAYPAVDLRRPSGPSVAEIDHGLLVTTGPSLWNTRPDGITFAPSLLVFRRKLKTHLFGHQYPDIIL